MNPKGAGAWMDRGKRAAAAATIVISALAQPAVAKPVALETESYHIASATPGIQLYIRNKRPAAITGFPGEKILLFVHGATYPSETTFDLSLNGLSMMDYIARQGWDVYLVDVRGYGGSTRPPEMDKPAHDHAPIVHTADAVRDIGSAVDHILKRRGVARINLMGWSWGTSIMGLYTARHHDKVNRLVLYAPQWLSNTPSLIGGDEPLDAYRTVSKTTARDRWLKGVPENRKTDLIPPGWFEQWADATWATDPVGAAQNPPVLRAPNGIIEDSRAYWRAGKPLYDPATITVPTLVIHAEWDQDLPSYQAQGYFARLTNAPYKRFVEIGGGTHTVLMERNRMQLFREVMMFLDEPEP